MSVRGVTGCMLQGEGVEKNANHRESQNKRRMIIYVIGRWSEGE